MPTRITTGDKGSGGSWYQIRVQAERAEVLIYDEIGAFGVTAKEFVREFEALTVPNILLRLNTPGGDVFDGLAIYNAVRARHTQTDVRVDGLAASVGSLIALGGRSLTMQPTAFLMLHNPWAIAIGDAETMRQMAATLEKVGGTLARVYAGRGIPIETVRAWMDAETWFTAQEALDARLIDRIESAEPEASSEPQTQEPAARWNLSHYRRVPAALRQLAEAPDESEDMSAMQVRWRRRRLALAERTILG